MKRNLRAGLSALAIAFILEQPVAIVTAQQRLPNHIDGQRKTVLRGSRNPRIEGLVSEGAVEDSLPVSGITFRFKPTSEQQMDLERLLEEQQDASSPQYRAWLTPEEYGERFGLKAHDYSKVREWIISQGFQVDYVAKSRSHISFSGSAGQLRKTFGTELRYYRINGNKHFANVSEIEVPSEIAPIVESVWGLDDFPGEHAGKIIPAASSNTGVHAITPNDLAVIYNLKPLYEQGINGAGQAIVVAGESAFNIQDVRKFRDTVGLPPNDPKIVLVPGVRDPGLADALGEALLDVEAAGGAAPGAKIIYVYGPNAARATEYAVDQNLAPVISYSFVACETQNKALWGWYRNVVQQAAVQGITWVAASGDTGAAGCESPLKDGAGANGLAVNLPASVPEVTGVGGTEFLEGNGLYWSSIAGGAAVARSYIPEIAWNDTGKALLSASGGGPSAVYPRPNWQSGPGVPDNNARNVPDIAFSASKDHDPYAVVINGELAGAGGTSAATPFFAGVVALLNHYVVHNGLQSKAGLGNINPRLYALAQSAAGVFHDVTTGSNMVPCKTGTPDCTAGQYGYKAGTGYDYVTGLGSIDAANLFAAWSSVKSNPNPMTNIVVSASPSPAYRQTPDPDGYKWFVTIYVKETGGAPARITAVTFDDQDLSDSIAVAFGTLNLPARGTLAADWRLNDSAIGAVPSDHSFKVSGIDSRGKPWSEQILVRFLGEKAGAAITLISNPATVVKIADFDPHCSADLPYYQQLLLREQNGAAVTLNRFNAGGHDYSNKIADAFGSRRLPALGTLQADLCWWIDKAPATLSYVIEGTDETGQEVQTTLNVDFKNLDGQSGMAPSYAGAYGQGLAETARATGPTIESAPLILAPMGSRPAIANRRK